jgi:hypothetical protein
MPAFSSPCTRLMKKNCTRSEEFTQSVSMTCLQVSQGKTFNSSTTPTTYTYKVAKRNVLKTLFTVFGCFVLCASCNEFFFFVYFIGVSVDFSGVFYHFTVFAIFSNCCLNPLIYALKYNDFRSGFKLFMDRTLRRRTDTVHPLSSALTTDTPFTVRIAVLDPQMCI